MNALFYQINDKIESTVAINESTDQYLERQIESLSDAIEEHNQEQWRYAGWQKNLQKEFNSLKLEKNRMQESAATYDESIKTFVTPAYSKAKSAEPSRLETLIVEEHMDTRCQRILAVLQSQNR